ncbi:MAG: GIY-YIG nuclease family protein [Planctomycetes bacterium]|nr:GIY-YIG nuclease family protein [Planctomycetota bacterium]
MNLMAKQCYGYVYILKSNRNGTYYIGSTQDLEKRLERHNNGFVKATRNIRPLTIAFYQKYETIKEAKQIEYKLKPLKSRKIIEQIITEGCIKVKPTRP